MEQNLQLSGGNKRKLFSVLVILPMLDITKQDERKISLSLFHQFFFCGKANYGWCHQPQSIALASRLKKAISISTINSRSSIFFASRDSTMIWLHIRLWKLYPRTSIAWSVGSYRRNKNLIQRCLTKSFCRYQGTLLFEGNIVSELHFYNPREDTMLLS